MAIRSTEMIEQQEITKLKALLDRRRRDDVRVLAMLTVLCFGLRKEETLRLLVGDYRCIEGQPCLVSQTVKRRTGKEMRRVIPIVASVLHEVLALLEVGFVGDAILLLRATLNDIDEPTCCFW